MRQTLLVVAALMLVLSVAAFAVAPVHAQASDCPGVSTSASFGRSLFGSGVADGSNFTSTAPYSPLNDCNFIPPHQF